MLLFYNLGIRLYQVLIQLACLKSLKARAFINGRKNLLERIEHAIIPGQKHIWFHFASLGEFEQGRPVLEQMRKNYPESRIFITFFSPSGFEIRKNYPLADHIFYLPLDTSYNAERFINAVNPEMAIFTKYEYWYHYFTELKKREIPVYMISAIFRKDQAFFKWFGGIQRKILTCVRMFFVQNVESKVLLEQLNLTNVRVSGDTRFDRVYENTQNPKRIDLVKKFCSDRKVIVAGSTWLPDEKLVSSIHEMLPNWKLIIAPHEVEEARIKEIEALFPDSVRFTRVETTESEFRTLIIDNIGMLSSLYQYGNIAYIGGGFGAGIHNTLEAAAFGLPVIFGPKYGKFKEAKDLIELEAAFPVADLDAFRAVLKRLSEEDNYLKAGSKAFNYVETNTGATDLILKHIDYPPN
ncbi:3-deoxy-D-manno-octulosonic acid transferase [Flavihumibacter sp. R14]|nr:3-deoxy-D-manno-octulosonic acid transferase [Flavihumibacter soli]